MDLSPALDFFEFGFKFAEILEKEHESAVTETMLIQLKLMLKGQSSEILILLFDIYW